jgi:hypothetical protein
MTSSRRRWIGCCTFGFFVGALSNRESNAYVAAAQCTGLVTDQRGLGVSDLIVEIVDYLGGISTTNTEKDNSAGKYEINVPKGASPYIIVFREPRGGTRLLDVRQLTGGTSQVLNLTIDATAKGFAGGYNSLQAVESLATWIYEDRERRKPALSAIKVSALEASVKSVVDNLDVAELKEDERSFLKLKATLVSTLLSRLV